jgi:AcrR family transcriptional regulator
MPRPRGRPKSEDTAAIGVRILEVAGARFLAEGYSALAMEAVAADAKVSKPTLYARYPDKPHLFRAVLVQRSERWKKQSVLEELPLRGTLRQRLERYATVVLDLLLESEVGAFMHIVTAEAPRFPEVALTYFEVTVEYGLALLKRHVVNADDVTISDQEAEEIASRLYEMLWGWRIFQLMRGLRPDEKLRRAGAQRCVRILLQGIPLKANKKLAGESLTHL